MAGGDLEELTELQYNAIPYIVATICSLENGTYKGVVTNDSVTMTVEELTELRLHGKVNPRSQDSSNIYSEPTDIKEWQTVRNLDPSSME